MAENYEEREISLVDYFQVVKKRWKFIAAITIVATVISCIIALNLPKVYQAKAVLRIGKRGDKLLESISATEEVVTSLYTLKQIVQKLGMAPEEENARMVKGKITIEGLKNADDIMVIYTKNASPEGAKNLAEIICKMVVDRHRPLHEKVKTERKKYLEELTIHVESLAKRTIGFSAFFSEPTIVEVPSTASGVPISPRKKRIVSIVFILSLFGSVLLSFMIESFSEKKG